MSRTLTMVGLAVLILSLAANGRGGEASRDASVAELWRAGDIDGAVSRAAEIVAENPDDVSSHVVRQDLLKALGRHKELRREYRESASDPAANADDLYLYGRVLEGSSAIRRYRDALRKDPRHFWTLSELGSALAERGRLTEARGMLEKARTVRPGSGVPVNALGRLEEKAGDETKAETLYREAIRLSPALTAARVNLGILLVGTGRAGDAVEVLTRAVDGAPSDPAPRLALGRAQLESGDAEAAVATFAKAVRLRSNTPSSLNLLASAYIELEQYDLAASALTRALELNPKDLLTRMSMAYLALARDDVEGARTAAKEALRLDPRCARARYLLGICELNAGNVRGADSEYQRALRLEPSNVTYLRALRMLHGAQGHWPRAVTYARKIVQLSDESPDSLMELALTYLGAGLAKRAAVTFDRVLTADPDRLDAWLNLGVVCQARLKDLPRARRAYEEYLDRGGKDPRVSTWLGQVTAK